MTSSTREPSNARDPEPLGASAEAAWRRFETLARHRDAEGRATMIPVLGTGFNAQAKKRLDWRDLLVRVAHDLGLDLVVPEGEALVGNTTLVWEAMLTEIAQRSRQKPYRVEAELERHVRAVLLTEYPVGGATKELATRLSSARFRDVVSFNFDHGFHTTTPTWVRERDDRFDPVWDHAIHAETGARVWYPHGSVIDAESLQLGQRKYGLLIQELERARRGHKSAEEAMRKALFPRKRRRLDSEAYSPEEREAVWEAQRPHTKSWLSAAMTSPLVFLGLSLGREEWALWWFLNQRRRNLARAVGRDHALADRHPAFVLVQAGEAARLATAASLAGLTLLPFRDRGYDEAWARVLAAFTGAVERS
ncbi:MAG: hypothetical protein K1X94_13680 [Sandaracinaceae bacterium]|nr:hypothetical protein [Sandaracinaceae bacterium]